MKTQVIENYGKVSIYNYLQNVPKGGKKLKKYRCRWVKARRYYCGTAEVLAENIDEAINRATKLKGFKPSVIQRV